MIFHIVEFDNDYPTVCGHRTIECDSREEAEKWCEDASWDGIDYFLSPYNHPQ